MQERRNFWISFWPPFSVFSLAGAENWCLLSPKAIYFNFGFINWSPVSQADRSKNKYETTDFHHYRNRTGTHVVWVNWKNWKLNARLLYWTTITVAINILWGKCIVQNVSFSSQLWFALSSTYFCRQKWERSLHFSCRLKWSTRYVETFV